MTTPPAATKPDPAVARILGLMLADLAHPKLYTSYSWAVDLAGNPVPTTHPTAVRWSLHGMVRRHALPDEELAGRTWRTITAHFPEQANFQQRATDEDRVRVVTAALEDVEAQG